MDASRLTAARQSADHGGGMKAILNTLKGAPYVALDFLLPPRCPICRGRIESHGHLCGDCWSSLEMIAEPICRRCGIPFAHEVDEADCGACLARPPGFDSAYAPVLYQGVGRDLVLGLKYGAMMAAVPAMARMMAVQLSRSAAPPDLIVPVPLHWTRLLKRRFNQSQLLARDIGKDIGKPVQSRILRRIRATPSQGTLGRGKRFKNVKSAFSVPVSERGIFAGKNILLVDDVLTTGATASACAEALKEAGACRVDLVAFARVGEPIAG